MHLPRPALLLLYAVLASDLCGAAQTPNAPAPAVPQLRTASLRLNVTIDYDTERITGTARVELENAGGQAAGEASLLLGRLMAFEDVRDDAQRSLPFRQETVVYSDDPKRQVRQAVVPLTPPLPAGGRRSLEIRYAGFLVGYTETGSSYIQDHVERDFTVLREDAYAFPVVAVPSLADSGSVARIDFPYEISVTVPADLTVANGGELVSREALDKTVRWTYRSGAPAPFLNVTVAPYQLLTGDGVRIFAFPGDSAGAARVLERTRSVLALYTRWFGAPARPPEFAVIAIPEHFGSQASLVAGIIQEADVFQPGASLQPLYHEISHFWNAPDAALSCRWNEGLAMYLQRRAARELDGWTGMDADLEKRIDRLRSEGKAEPRLATVAFRDYGPARMTDWSYSVGMAMFALLDRVLGAEAFDELIGGYYRDHHAGPTTCADFGRFVADRGGAQGAAVAHDWFETTHWWTGVAAGASFTDLTSRYRVAAAPPSPTAPPAPGP